MFGGFQFVAGQSLWAKDVSFRQRVWAAAQLWYKTIATWTKKLIWIELMLRNYSKDDYKAILLGDFNFDRALNLFGPQLKAKNFLSITSTFHLTQIIS